MAAVIKLGGAGRGVRRHLRSFVKLAVIPEIGGDPGRAKAVVADQGLDAGLAGTPAHHLEGTRSRQPVRPQRLSAAHRRPERWPFGLGAEIGHLEIIQEIDLEGMMAGHDVMLAALLISMSAVIVPANG